MSQSVAIVILNWNGKDFLEKFLPFVNASTYTNKKIIVADNGSSDDSISFVRSRYPDVQIIELGANHGFAKGYNLALKQVNADYFLLLNSDVEVQPGWIEPMVQLLESDKNIAACQPKLLAYSDHLHFEYAGAAGGWLDQYGYPFAKGRVFDICEEDSGQYNRSTSIFWASGAAMFIRSSVYNEMGGFDDYFFAHQEEIDLCWRIQLAGYKIYSCPASVVYHVGGGTLPKGNSRKTYLNFRNNMIMIYKNMPWSEKWWKIPYRQLLNGVSAWKGLFNGDGGYFVAIVRAHVAFAKWWLFFKRKSVFPRKRNRKRDVTLSGYYKGNIAWKHFVNGKKKFTEIVKD